MNDREGRGGMNREGRRGVSVETEGGMGAMERAEAAKGEEEEE